MSGDSKKQRLTDKNDKTVTSGNAPGPKW